MSKSKYKPLPTQEYLAECFDYNPETGDLIWKERPLSHFAADYVMKSTNDKLAGKIAGQFESRGRRTCTVNKNKYNVRRLIWKLVTGNDPEYDILQADKDFSNFKFSNLIDFDMYSGYKNPTIDYSSTVKLRIEGLYAVLFSNGTVKIGLSTDILHRIASHTTNAKAFSCELIEQSYVETNSNLKNKEAALMKLANPLCKEVLMNEWFVEGDYKKIKESMFNISNMTDDEVRFILRKKEGKNLEYIKKTNELPSQEYLQSIFNYNSETGDLTWKERPREHFSSDFKFNHHNNRIGTNAKGTMKTSGRTIIIDEGVKLSRHRVIWKLIFNQEPRHIYHLNGDIDDDRLVNLSNESPVGSVTPSSSGCKGVTWDNKDSRWKVYLKNEHSEDIGLGSFPELADAIFTRLVAEQKLSTYVRFDNNIEDTKKLMFDKTGVSFDDIYNFIEITKPILLEYANKGLSVSKTAKALNSKGFLTRTGVPWNGHSVMAFLNQIKYL